MVSAPDLQRAAPLARARQSLLAFTKAQTPNYRAGWVHGEIAAHMERFSAAVARGESPRLVLTVPPRYGKSRLAECLATWHLGHNPHHEVIVAGFALGPAQDRTRAAREMALDADARLSFPMLSLSRDTASKTDWRLEVNGKRAGGAYAAGVRGTLTSKGANILIVDDPFKDWETAQSPAMRMKAWDWYRSTARTRLAPGGGVLVIQTRWHEDDLAGRVTIEHAHENWQVINYPAIAEEHEYSPLTGVHLRSPGQALHPQRFSLTELEHVRISLGPVMWACLYQQRPMTPGGEIWKRPWFRHWSVRDLTPAQIAAGWKPRPHRFDEITLSADFSAGSESTTASFAVIDAWGRVGADAFLLEEWRRRCQYPEQRSNLIDMIARHQPRRVFVEDAAHGKALIQELRSTIHCIEAVPAVGSKVSRAHAAAATIEQGHIYLPDPSLERWVEDWLVETTTFPSAANDDRVDTASQAIRGMLQARTGSFLAGVRV